MIPAPSPALLHREAVNDRADLDGKVEILLDLIARPDFPEVVPDQFERQRLRRQAAAMATLSDILRQRIAAFGQPGAVL